MLKRVCLLVVLAALLFAPVAAAQSNSTLKQQITAAGCSFTTIATGMGVTHDSTCPVFAPTIESIKPNRGRPVIRGIFDAAHSSEFRVRVNGVWYALGSSPELASNGNVWTLGLSGLEPPLGEGTYAIMAEMRATDGSLWQTGGAVIVKPITSLIEDSDGEAQGGNGDEGGTDDEVSNELPGDEKESASAKREARLATLTYPFVILLVATSVFWLLVGKKRRKRRRDGDI